MKSSAIALRWQPPVALQTGSATLADSCVTHAGRHITGTLVDVAFTFIVLRMPRNVPSFSMFSPLKLAQNEKNTFVLAANLVREMLSPHSLALCRSDIFPPFQALLANFVFPNNTETGHLPRHLPLFLLIAGVGGA